MEISRAWVVRWVNCDEVSCRQRWWGGEREVGGRDVLSWKKALFTPSRQSEGASRAMAGATAEEGRREKDRDSL